MQEAEQRRRERKMEELKASLPKDPFHHDQPLAALTVRLDPAPAHDPMPNGGTSEKLAKEDGED